MEERDPKLESVWRQKEVPVIFLKERKSRPMIKVGSTQEDAGWIMSFKKSYGGWWRKNYSCWDVPKSWFAEIAKELLIRYGSVYIVQPFNENEKCCPSCWNAVGIECVCSCLGANHGSGKPLGKWYDVVETFASKWDGKNYGCKLITPFSETDIITL